MSDTELLDQENETQVDDAEAQAADTEETIEHSVDANADVDVDTEQVEADAELSDADGDAEVVAEFDDSLLDRAEQYGLTEHEIENHGSPESLESYLDAIDRRAVQELRQNAANQQPPAQPPAQTPPVQQPPAQPPVQPAAQQPQVNGHAPPPVDLEKLKETLDEDVYAAVESVYNANQAGHQRVQQLEQQFQQLAGNFEQQQRAVVQQNYRRQIDSMIANLGSEWESVLGKGPTDALRVKPELDAQGNVVGVTGPDKDKLLARNEFAQMVDGLTMTYSSRNIPFPGEEEISKRAVRAAFGQQQEKLDRERLRKRLSKKARRATKKPTHTKMGETKTPQQERAEMIAQLEADRAAYLKKQSSEPEAKPKPKSRKKK